METAAAYDRVLGWLLDAVKRRSEEDLERYLREEDLFRKGLDWLPDKNRRAVGYYQLSSYLSQLMMRAVNQLVHRGGVGGEAYLNVTDAPTPSRTTFSVDSQYLAALILTFIVLHEIGHWV